MTRTTHAQKAMNDPEHFRLDDDLRDRIAEHHARVNRRLDEKRTGIREVSRADVIRSLLRSALDAEEAGA